MGRTAFRAAATAAAALVGAVLLSGSDQPVTAHTYARWQELPPPPVAPRLHALGVAVGHRVLVLGGLHAGRPARGGAAYDLRTGIWRRVMTPVALTDRDSAAVAAGVVVLRHLRPAGSTVWWRYDVRQGTWSRMHDVPRPLGTPSALGSEVYAASGRRVGVYSVQLGRWTMLPADPRHRRLHGATVRASRHGTVVTGHPAGHPRLLAADRWDGLRWHRSRVTEAPAVTAPPDGETRVSLGGRILVVRGDRAWIRLP